MNKYLLIVASIFFCILSTPILSQIEFGFAGGVNMANFHGANEDVSYYPRIGFGGILRVYLREENAALHFQPTYLQKGAKASVMLGTETVDMNFKINYFEIPVLLLAKLSIKDMGGQPYIIVGPSFGYRISSSYEEKTQDLKVEWDITEFTQDRDFNMVLGAGVNYPIEKLAVFIDVRYITGIKDIFHGGQRNELQIPDVSLKNKGFQILAGITFRPGD